MNHEIPLGWSMGVGLATLAPGIWQIYSDTIQPNDEIICKLSVDVEVLTSGAVCGVGAMMLRVGFFVYR